MFRRKHSEEQFRILLEAAPNGVITVDAAGRITLLNAQAEKMFGYSRPELIGKPVETLVPLRFRDAHSDLRKRAAVGPYTRPMGTNRVFLAVRKDGSEFPVEVGLKSVLMSDGQVTVASVVDVTERMSERPGAWHVTTVVSIALVFGLVIAAALTPLARGIAASVLGFGKEHLARDVEAAYTTYRKGEYATAFRLARPMAEQGNSRAQSLLGLLYLNGQGVERNETEAVAWYRSAANRGDEDAQVKLGDMYLEGQAVPQDHSEAIRWYRLAANRGNAVAEFNLGVSYAKGEGVPVDDGQAHMWFNLAAVHFTSKLSRDRAAAHRDTIARKLSVDEISKAQQLARDWTASSVSAPGLGEWVIEQQGTKVMSDRNDPLGVIAKLPAKAPSDGVAAYLQIECFELPPLRGMHLGLVLSKPTTPGPLRYQYKFDDAAPVLRGPYSRRILTVVSLGDRSSDEWKNLPKARRLQLTLLPTQSRELTFDFDLAGASLAIDAITCEEDRKL